MNELKLKDVISAGGGTFDRHGQPIEKLSGFWVGGRSKVVAVPIWFLDQDLSILEVIDQALGASYPKPVGKDQGYGFWVETKTGSVNDEQLPYLLHIEISDHTINERYAIQLGQARDQIAIWDCYDSVEIRLK